MLTTPLRLALRKIYTELDYARHFPKAYVNRVKGHVPKKIYDNRYGAPSIIHWKLPPDDYVPGTKRPWEAEIMSKTVKREREYLNKKLSNKFFHKRINRFNMISAEEWTIFPGDMVEVMVGKDKGVKGLVSHVLRESNAVFVDGLHTELKIHEEMKQLKMDAVYIKQMRPLYVDKEQVKLVDPNDNEPCTAKWILNPTKTDYIRISERTGYEIPLPAQAFVTYEYMSPDDYIEVPAKDTPAKIALERTYEPNLCTFEGELEKEFNLTSATEYQPTYWY